jgi:hypothetical protein
MVKVLLLLLHVVPPSMTRYASIGAHVPMSTFKMFVPLDPIVPWNMSVGSPRHWMRRWTVSPLEIPG